ncbi:MAG: DNA/RNA non-specific endonuclease [Crocinitomicaceae bacterium]
MNKKARIIIWSFLIILVTVLIVKSFQKQSKNNVASKPQRNEVQKDQIQKIDEPLKVKEKAKELTVNKDKPKQTDKPNKSNALPISDLELPKIKKGEKIVNHLAYTLSYNEKYHQANWVAYLLTKKELVKRSKRSNNFKSDPKIYHTDFSDDYYKSGFDRGHLAPAADMSFSKEVMEESFYYSNMSPQTPSFNRGIWRKLEEKVRIWTQLHDSMYIVTGPLFDSSMQVIGDDKVAVPIGYYKALLQKRKDHWSGIGFLLPNKGTKSSLRSFVLSIDSLEHRVGYNFFYLLDDEVENKVEQEVVIGEW